MSRPPDTGAEAGPSASRGRFRLALAALAVATFLVFAPAISGGFFLLDDYGFVAGNPRVAAGLSLDGARWAWTTDHAGNWIPLAWISHQIDASLFGLDARGHHLTSVLLHALNAVLAALALERLTGARWRSFAVAALFALHPLRVESVAWISERKDVLAGSFFLLALVAYASWTRRGGATRYAALLAASAASLLAKPMAVTLPFVLLLLDRWPLRRSRGATLLLVEKLPLFAMVVGVSVATMHAQASWGALSRPAELTLAARLATACVAPLAYLGRTLWPFDLSVLYPHPYLPGGQPLSPAAIALGAGATLLVVALALASLARERARGLAPGVGSLWFLGMLLPVIGIVQVGEQAFADRYTYLPHLGFFIAVVWSAADLAASKGLSRRSLALALGLALALLATRASAQAAHWRDPLVVLERSLAATPDSPVLLSLAGREQARRGRLDVAERHLVRSVELRPLYAESRAHLGRVYLAQGRDAEAEAQLRLALRIRPRYELPLLELSGLELRRGHPAEALAFAERARREAPASPAAALREGEALEALGRRDEAVAAYRRCLELEPADALARARLAALTGPAE